MIQKLFDNLRPHFSEGGKLSFLHSVYEGFESFALVPSETSKEGVHIHDCIDSKRIIFLVVIALMPALLWGMYNIGYQNAVATNHLGEASWLALWFYGFLVMLPKIIVSYLVGLGIEFTVAQWRKEEINEGYLATGLLIPMILPVNTPLWMLALAVAFSVIFAKEIFGGTGMNIFNPALVARAFLFFSYPSMMSGDKVWVANQTVCGFGYSSADVITAATPLGNIAANTPVDLSVLDMVVGLIPGSVGETSVIAIALGALLLLFTGVASWKIMATVFAGGALTAWLFNISTIDTVVAQTPWYTHLLLGGFCFGAVFMATDPVTSARTEAGKYIYGFGIGMMAIIIRVLNEGYPEGMMLAILFMNMCAPLIDYVVVERNIKRRAKRVGNAK